VIIVPFNKLETVGRNVESASNVTDDREKHSEKQFSQITSTDEGM
jgi:hypothetical protein